MCGLLNSSEVSVPSWLLSSSSISSVSGGSTGNLMFVGVLELFVYEIICLPSEDDATIQVISIFPDVVCWQGMYNLHASLGIVISVVFLAICLICALSLYESKESQKNVAAKVSSRADFGLLIAKTVILYMFAFLYQP